MKRAHWYLYPVSPLKTGIYLNTIYKTKRPLKSCRLVSFLVFNLGSGKRKHGLKLNKTKDSKKNPFVLILILLSLLSINKCLCLPKDELIIKNGSKRPLYVGRCVFFLPSFRPSVRRNKEFCDQK